MRRCLYFIFITIFSLTFFTILMNAQIIEKNHPFVLVNFNNNELLTTLNTPMGVFNFNPKDPEAYCKSKIIKDKDLHKKGYYLQVDYDVYSSKDAFSGVWINLNNLNFNFFKEIQIYLKGDKKLNFNDKIKLELKDNQGNKAIYIIKDITSNWHLFKIRKEDFEIQNIFNWSNLKEMVFVFEDWRFNIKVGRYYLDDIIFIPKNDTHITIKDLKQ